MLPFSRTPSKCFNSRPRCLFCALAVSHWETQINSPTNVTARILPRMFPLQQCLFFRNTHGTHSSWASLSEIAEFCFSAYNWYSFKSVLSCFRQFAYQNCIFILSFLWLLGSLESHLGTVDGKQYQTLWSALIVCKFILLLIFTHIFSSESP